MKLLVVDDDRMFAELIRRGLKEEGYTVDVARNVAEGRIAALVNDYDGIVLDVVMPDGNGMQLASELRERQAARPARSGSPGRPCAGTRCSWDRHCRGAARAQDDDSGRRSAIDAAGNSRGVAVRPMPAQRALGAAPARRGGVGKPDTAAGTGFHI